jgi:hypothetical protein
MKTPLHYQTTEYDCGPTSVINAISFLFDRKEIPPEVPKMIMMYCLDEYNTKGEAGKHGTSQMAIQFLSNWFNQFSKAKKFPVCCEYLSGTQVGIFTHSAIVCALQQGGVVILRLMYDTWHYVLLTGALDGAVEMFDPYYREKPFADGGIQMTYGNESGANRIVKFEVFNKEKLTDYALGPIEMREAVIMFNSKIRKTPEATVEYFI